MVDKTIKFNHDKFVKQYGVHCPCKISNPDSLADVLSKTCPCEEFMDTGKCICGLFEVIEDGE